MTNVKMPKEYIDRLDFYIDEVEDAMTNKVKAEADLKLFYAIQGLLGYLSALKYIKK